MAYGRGHERGTRRQRPRDSDWYGSVAEATLLRLDAEEAEAQARQQAAAATEPQEEEK